ncbi:Translation initiation factor IF-3 [Candidatus Hodgkinia cicadicola]|nr:Translation initiation factor IF-3 [Candidatus Hodgkinia cicadicola]
MISLIAQNGEFLGQMTYDEAQQVALINRLNLVRVSAPSLYKLIDMGKRKYLEKKRKSKTRLANRLIKKHIEIKSNIDTRDLDIKFSAISRFLNNGYRISVMVRHLKLTTAEGAYEDFVDVIKDKISNLTVCFDGPIQTETGDNMFYLFGDDPQNKRSQAKN